MMYFNEKETRKRYLEANATLQQDDDLLDRLICRHELLARNDMFLEEWQELELLHKNGYGESYVEKRKRFFDRWKVSHPSGLHQLTGYPGAPVRVVDADYSGRIKIEVNLNLSKTRLLKEIKRELYRWHDLWSDLQENGIKETTPFCEELKGNKIDTDSIKAYIQAWTLKREGKSRRQINKILPSGLMVNDPAKDFCKAADKLIKKGLPGFPPFPQKE